MGNRLRCILEEMARGATVEGPMPPPGETEENCKICCDSLGNSGTQGGGGPPYMGGGGSPTSCKRTPTKYPAQSPNNSPKSSPTTEEDGSEITIVIISVAAAVVLCLGFIAYLRRLKTNHMKRVHSLKRNVSELSLERNAVRKNFDKLKKKLEEMKPSEAQEDILKKYRRILEMGSSELMPFRVHIYDGLKDFVIEKVIGKGAYGQVLKGALSVVRRQQIGGRCCAKAAIVTEDTGIETTLGFFSLRYAQMLKSEPTKTLSALASPGSQRFFT